MQGIKGFLGLSLIDYPGRPAAVVFVGGCNLECGYCHNRELARFPSRMADLELGVLLEELSRRRKLIEGVVVTGGEPTLHPHLPILLRAIKALGLPVKLDTNGLCPEILESLAGSGLVDYLAVDLKTSPERYVSELGAAAAAPRKLAQTAAWLRTSGLDYEFRTTCVPGLVEEADLSAMRPLLEGAPAFYLQQYRPVSTEAGPRGVHPVQTLERWLNLIRPWVGKSGLRNVAENRTQPDVLETLRVPA